jgi:hypothetical protein
MECSRLSAFDTSYGSLVPLSLRQVAVVGFVSRFFHALSFPHRPYLHGGLWRNYRIEEVASPEAWHRDPRLVWEFYSMHRRVAASAAPNPAHLASAALALVSVLGCWRTR